jgi:hypothetical protein
VRWDRERTVYYPMLAVQFVVCVGCWVAVVLLLAGEVSRDGLLASVVTGFVLVAVSWVLAKCGVPPSPVLPGSAQPAAGSDSLTA